MRQFVLNSSDFELEDALAIECFGSSLKMMLSVNNASIIKKNREIAVALWFYVFWQHTRGVCRWCLLGELYAASLIAI